MRSSTITTHTRSTVAPAAAKLADHVMMRCDLLAALSEEQGSITRRFATLALDQAMIMVGEWMRAAGMTIRRDCIGNLIGRYEAAHAGAQTLLLGSHLDSVRDAGRYDGPLGVVVGIACVERLFARDQRLPFAIEVVAFADEEGARYHTTYLGSQVMAGCFDLNQLALLDDAGVSMADAIRSFGGNPAALAHLERRTDVLGYCEVHIEQGPVLESLGLPVGVVSAIAGQSRATATFCGTAGHAGTVPMSLRRDALCAAAEFVLAVETRACQTPGLVATVGQLEANPGVSNVIPGAAKLTLDVRHYDDTTRLAAVAELQAKAKRIAHQRQIALDWQLIMAHACVPCDSALSNLLARSVAVHAPVHVLASGAGHDGVVLSTAMPITMLFVRCAGGISHNPAESVDSGDVAVAIDVLDTMFDQLAKTL